MSTPSDLASAAKCYCFDDATERSIIVYLLVNGATNMTPSELAIAAKSYSYDLDTWKKVVVYLLDGNGAETPNALAEASKCFCFDNGAFKRIVAYLLNKGGGGGPCPQDMQVTWTPTNLKLGELVMLSAFQNATGIPGITSLTINQTTNREGFDLESCPDLTSFSAPSLATITDTGYFFLSGSSNLTTVSLPALTSVGAGLTIKNNTALTSIDLSSFVTSVADGNSVEISGNTSLTTLSLPSLLQIGTVTWGNFLINNNTSLSSLNIPVFVPRNGSLIDASGGNLNTASVNLILHRCVLNGAYVTGIVDTSGGTNAAPSGQGVADKATLIGRGVTVNTN